VLERYGVSGIGQAGRELVLEKKGGRVAARLLYRLGDRLARERFNLCQMKSSQFGKSQDSGPAFIDMP
jgi:hypothetical protein